MTPFLRQVAQFYVKSHKEGRLQLRDLCFVFPNRRAIAFFRKWLCEEAASSGIAPLMAPAMVTINDFFSTAADVKVTDRINLLVVLYECYRKLYPKAETLDDFIYWGDVLLGDFNDVDKYRVDPSQIFTNVADFKAIQDDYSHLSENQEKAIRAFIEHFKSESAEGGVKETFRQIWSILYPLYMDFNEALRGKSWAYEGMVYRSFAERLDRESASDILSASYPHTKQFVFVGLNALNECEKHVLGKMSDAGLAQFCWDWSGKMIKDPLNKSSLFMSENVKRFRPAFTPDPDGVALPEFNVVSVPSSVGQVKRVGDIVSGGRPDDYAVVLPDESLLLPLLNSIPPEISDINVTMGYPMGASEFYAFMHDVIRMQMHARQKGNQWAFYHKYVWNIFSSGIFRKLVDGNSEVFEKIDSIRKARKYYIPVSDLSGSGLPEVIFRPACSDSQAEDARQVDNLCAYLCDVVAFVGSRFRAERDENDEIQFSDAHKTDYALEIDFAKEYYTSLNRLRSMHLNIRPATFVHLLESMLASVSVPFTGEPLRGLQVMGPLETRALDFKNMVILSANEGMFPRRSVSSSFIPSELRKGFGLPTYEYQDAVWAYYFYRMITRAEKVWLLYDSRTEGLKSGEESRYIKQLRYHFHVPMNFYVAKSGIDVPDIVSRDIEKTAEDIEIIKSRSLSPSSVMNYIECPAKFYYHTVKRLKKEEEVSESMDAKMIGNVYHNVMRALLIGDEEMMRTDGFDKLAKEKVKGQERVTVEYLEKWLACKDGIRAKVMSLICAELNTDEVTGRDLVFAGVIVRYVLKTIESEIRMLKEAGRDSYEVIGAEYPLEHTIHGLKFFGIADRIDSIEKGRLRLVDYKTGKDDPSVLEVPDGDAETVVDAIFDPSNPKHRARKAGLQFYIYDRMMAEKFGVGLDRISNSMYATAKLFTELPKTSEVGESFATLMDERLAGVLNSMVDPEVAFARTEDKENCRYCDFRMICGR